MICVRLALDAIETRAVASGVIAASTRCALRPVQLCRCGSGTARRHRQHTHTHTHTPSIDQVSRIVNRHIKGTPALHAIAGNTRMYTHTSANPLSRIFNRHANGQHLVLLCLASTCGNPKVPWVSSSRACQPGHAWHDIAGQDTDAMPWYSKRRTGDAERACKRRGL